MEKKADEAVYGHVPEELVAVGPTAIQVSPLISGARDLETCEPGSLSRITMLAPPGTIERRYSLALALRALSPSGTLVALAPKDKGGSRLKKELTSFGCAITEEARRHHRIATMARPAAPVGIDAAIGEGSPQLVDGLGLWSQPGIFSWNRLDPGSALLLANLPAQSGTGADLGCGLGILAHGVLRSPRVTRLALVDLDRRAVAAARRNVDDARADFHWADLRVADAGLTHLDFVVMNPPFHDGGAEDKKLGQAFVRRAAQVLRPGGLCWLVANRHLPYEEVLKPLFRRLTAVVDQGGYKIYEAQK